MKVSGRWYLSFVYLSGLCFLHVLSLSCDNDNGGLDLEPFADSSGFAPPIEDDRERPYHGIEIVVLA